MRVITDVSVFRKTLYCISRELTDDEVQDLAYLCKDVLTVSQKEGIRNARALFEILEQERIVSENNLAFLVKMMEYLHRNDLKKKLLDIMAGSGNCPEQAEEQQPTTNLDNITIHCKDCSSLICKASELRQNGDAGHVTCTSPEFKEWVREERYDRPKRNRDSVTVGLIKCGTFHCRNQFGTLQKFLSLHPAQEGYDLKAQSFEIHHELGSVKTPTIWKEAGFRILQV